MYLLLAAPLFSQALADAQQAPGWLSEMACGEGTQAPVPSDTPLWAKCGYCTLLLSSPVLNAALPVLAGGPLPAGEPPAEPVVRAAGKPVIAYDAPPRAPPLRFV